MLLLRVSKLSTFDIRKCIGSTYCSIINRFASSRFYYYITPSKCFQNKTKHNPHNIPIKGSILILMQQI